MPGPTFLDLPEDIRFKIYELTGRISGATIRLNKIARTKTNSPTFETEFLMSVNFLDCDASYELGQIDVFTRERNPLLQSLFMTCRQLYLDTSHLVYSKNKIGVRNSDLGNIDCLLKLSPRIVSCLNDLTIRLNDPKRVYLTDLSDYIDPEHVHHNLHLAITSARDLATISHWRACARYLFLNMAPATLKLNFICDTRSESHEPDPFFHLLSKKASLYSTWNQAKLSPGPKAFPLMRLPKEIRLRILEYTDLVTPLCEVEWKRGYGMHVHYGDAEPWLQWCRGNCDKDRNYPEGHGCDYYYQSFHDWKRSRPHNQCKLRYCRAHPYTGCFCHRHHGAYTDDCRCWIPPTALFLVCRALRQDSIEVFYSKNRFIITPEGHPNQPYMDDIVELPIETWLRDSLPQESVRFIRHLQIVFSPFKRLREPLCSFEDHESLYELALELSGDEPVGNGGNSGHQSWIRAIELMSTHLPLPALTLEVFVAEWHVSRTRPSQIYYCYRSLLTEEQGKAVECAYLNSFRPLDRLKGLKTFFIHLGWPWFGKSLRSEWDPARYEQIFDTALRSTKAIEKEIESHVMGAAYDSALHGKAEYLDDTGWRFESGHRGLFEEDSWHDHPTRRIHGASRVRERVQPHIYIYLP